MNHATAAPVRLKQPSTALRCDILRTVGFRASCPDCGWRGSVRDFDTARAEARIHACEDTSPSERAEAS